jgi:hypothetical protein
MKLLFLAFVGAIAAAPMAQAGVCPAEISGLTRDTGEVLTIEGRSGDAVTLRFTSADYSFVYRDQAGLIPLDAQGIDGPIVYDWATPLPAVADLVPGAAFRLDGRLAGDGQDEAVAMDIRVVGPESLTVGNCAVAVLKVEITNLYAGQTIGLTTHYLHLPSLLILRSEMVPEGDEVIISAAASLQ